MNLPFATVDGTTYSLRPPAEQDVQKLYEAADSSRRELGVWMPWCHDEYSVADTQNWVRETLAAESEASFVIWNEDEDVCLGTCGLNAINPRHRFANLGYWVRSSHTGRGIASAATLRVAKYGFEELGLVRVEIVAALGNLASQGVAKRVHATREGVLRNGLLHGETPRDAVLFSLIPEDLQ